MSTPAARSQEDAGLAMLLTPPGSGAIAVVRLTGARVVEFAKNHLSRPPAVGRCLHADLRDESGTVLDDVVAVLTDDDALDLNLHAGPYVIQATLELVSRWGFRVTPWSDAPANAFDTTDAIERQVLLDLPRAKSATILRLLTAQPALWAEMLRSNDVSAMKKALADSTLERALAVPTVAIVGPPNVGKSTLANALFGQQRSITADRPGTTRDWVGELADLDGLIIQLIDTPGVRQTADPIEAQAIQQAAGVTHDADCILIVVDGSCPLDANARALLRQWRGVNSIVLRSKADRPRRCDIPEVDLDLSVVSGQGLAELRPLIRSRLGAADVNSLTARCWTESQRAYLRSCLAGAAAGI